MKWEMLSATKAQFVGKPRLPKCRDCQKLMERHPRKVHGMMHDHYYCHNEDHPTLRYCAYHGRWWREVEDEES